MHDAPARDDVQVVGRFGGNGEFKINEADEFRPYMSGVVQVGDIRAHIFMHIVVVAVTFGFAGALVAGMVGDGWSAVSLVGAGFFTAIGIAMLGSMRGIARLRPVPAGLIKASGTDA
jgi:hypothetical protein